MSTIGTANENRIARIDCVLGYIIHHTEWATLARKARRDLRDLRDEIEGRNERIKELERLVPEEAESRPPPEILPVLPLPNPQKIP